VHEPPFRQFVHPLPLPEPRPFNLVRPGHEFAIPRFQQIRLRNDRLAESARSHHFDDDVSVPFLCECDRNDCIEFVQLRLTHYGEITEQDYVTVPGHRIAAAKVVWTTATYRIHRPHGTDAGAASEAL
jgi:hypothetical protein